MWGLDPRHVLYPAGTVAELLRVDADAIEQREVEIRHRRVGRVHDMTPWPQATALADHGHGQIVVRVPVAVAQAAAVDDDRVIEERAVTVGGLLHLLD